MSILTWNKTLKIRLAGEAFVNIVFWMMFPFLALYFNEQLGKHWTGPLLVIAQFSAAIVGLFGGYLSDRYGRKRMMILSCLFQAGGHLLFASTIANPWLSFFSYTILTMASSVYWPASQAMVADLVEEKDRAHVFAIFYTSLNLAVVIGPLIGSFLFFDYLVELQVTAAAIFVCLALVLWRYAEESIAVTTKVTSFAAAWREQFTSYRVILTNRIFMLYVVAGILSSLVFVQLDLIIPIYLKAAASYYTFGPLTLSSEKAFSALISINGLLVALLTVATTKWGERFSDKSVFIASSLLYGMSMMIFPFTKSFAVFLLAIIGFTFAELLVVGLQQSFVAKISPDDQRGQYFAAASLRFTIGRSLAPIVITLTTLFSFMTTFAILFALCVLSAVIYHMMFKQLDAASS